MVEERKPGIAGKGEASNCRLLVLEGELNGSVHVGT